MRLNEDTALQLVRDRFSSYEDDPTPLRLSKVLAALSMYMCVREGEDISDSAPYYRYGQDLYEDTVDESQEWYDYDPDC